MPSARKQVDEDIPTVLKVEFLPGEQHKNAEGLDPDLRKE